MMLSQAKPYLGRKIRTKQQQTINMFLARLQDRKTLRAALAVPNVARLFLK